MIRPLLAWALIAAFTYSVWWHGAYRLLVTAPEAGAAAGVVNVVLRVLLVGYGLAGISDLLPSLRVAPLRRRAWGRATGFVLAAFLLVPLWSQGVFWLLWRRLGAGANAFGAEAVYLEPSLRAEPWVLEAVLSTGLAVVAALWFARAPFRRFWSRLARPTLMASILLAAFPPFVFLTTGATTRLVGQCQDPASREPRPPWLLCQSLVHSRPPLGFAIPFPTPSGHSAPERDLGHVLWTRAFLLAQTRPHSPVLAGLWEFGGRILSLSLWATLATLAWRAGRSLVARVGRPRRGSPL
ncbi:hypothetical protein IIA16_07110 [bacterium]|nr:hypothetical protein [bacterium]